MVAPSYQDIIKFGDVAEGQIFASSKTGDLYRVDNGILVCLYKRTELEYFKSNDLVYINVLPDGAIN